MQAISFALFLVAIFGLGFLLAAVYHSQTLAASSTNYQIPSEDIGTGRDLNPQSLNYQVEDIIGDPALGESTGINYQVDHGFYYPEEAEVLIDLLAIPELRVPPTGNNDTHLTVEVRNVGETSPLFTQTVDTDENGQYSNLLLAGINPGAYDLTAKGYSHLRKKISNTALGGGLNNVDFSNAGTEFLLGGDVNGTNGDNIVNSVDLAVETIKLDESSAVEREDINQDGMVNSIDLAITIKNLDIQGDQ